MPRPALQPIPGFLLAAALLAGCGGSGQNPSFETGGPIGRTKAIGDAAARGDQNAIPDLIESLWSADPAERMLAIRALESMTGETLGYGFSDPEPKRTAAADRWVSWWRAESSDPNWGVTQPSPRSRGAMRGR